MQSIHDRALGFGVVFQMVLGFEVVIPLLSLPIASRNLIEIQDADFVKVLDFIIIYFFYTGCQELMNSVGSHRSLSLLFMMKVMV
jgi:hypothetical protein